MNWIDYVWPMVAGICLTLGLVHLGSGLRGASRRVNLLFALIAFLMVVYSVIEWRLMHATSPPQYLSWLRLLDFAGSAIAMMLAVFTRVYFAAGRRWLLLLGIGVTSASLILDMLPTPQLGFRDLTHVTQVPTFGGATYAFAEGVRNPWNAAFYLGLALLIVFVGHVTGIQCRHGDCRRALLIGGTIVTTFVLASVHASLVDVGIMRTPYMLSVTWLFVLVAMAGELSNDQVRAVRLSRELRESQERLQLATSAADLGVWDWDVVRDSIHASALVWERLGLKETEPLDFNRYLESVHPEDRPRFEQTVRRALDGGSEFEAEYRVITPDGEPRWISARGRVERGLSGKPIHLLGVSMDITGRKSAEIEAEQLRRDLAHVSRETTLNELSVSLAHELNQPLGIILSNAQAAQDLIAGNPQVPGEVGEILSDIVAADRRAAAVIQQMRAMLKRGEPLLTPLSVDDVMEEVLTLMRADFITRGITAVSELAPDLPRVMGDRVQIQQVLINLLLNASDAMMDKAPGTRRLTLATSHKGDQVRVSVRDEGPGLPPDCEQIFGPFFTTKKRGLGLGLTICRSIIAAHQGRFWAENHPQGGAVFFFELAAANPPAVS